jgi:hypothetical protein
MMGILEFIFIALVGIIVIGAYLIAIKKIINSKMSSNQKVLWILVIFIFNFLGLVAFLVYHENYLSPSLRGEFRW